jgi:hypothetical protein
MELIDREVYRREMEKSIELMARAGESQNDIACGMKRALRLLDMQDVVDAKEVKHGGWIDRDGKTWCSLCHASNKQYKPPFCPHCGAMMDGKELGK